jgi:hypothetical protein
MAKARMTDLSDLLETRKATPVAPKPVPTPDGEGAVPKPAKRPAVPKAAPAAQKQKTEAPPAVTVPSAPVGLPRYKTLVRKESRLTAAQADRLSGVVRGLNLARQGQGERITDNTLIRVGLELLFTRLDDLHGTTEADLLRSLGLAETD